MSRHDATTERFEITVGYDLPLHSLFAQVWSKGQSHEDEPLLWLGADAQALVRLPVLRERLAPYGPLPLALQATLLEELDADRPLSFPTLCREMVELCRQAPESRLADSSLAGTAFWYLVLDEQGWHTHEWNFPTGALAESAYAIAVYTGVSTDPMLRAEAVASYVSDPGVFLRVDEDGHSNRRPVYAGVRNANGGAGAFFSGPVVCAGEYSGLTVRQVQGVVTEEVFVVVPELRQAVTRLWYRGWETMDARPRDDRL